MAPSKDYAPKSSRERTIQAVLVALRSTGYSRSALIKLVESDFDEKYSNADATWAVDAFNLDWNHEAEIVAYNNFAGSKYTRDEVVKLLLRAGFTQAQAEHGANVQMTKM